MQIARWAEHNRTEQNTHLPPLSHHPPTNASASTIIAHPFIKHHHHLHLLPSQFSSSGVGIGGASSTPPLKFAHGQDAKDEDYRFSPEKLDYVAADSEDSADVLSKLYGERVWHHAILGMYGDELA